MSAIYKSFRMFISQLTKDGMMLMLIFVPILSAVFFRFGIPYIEDVLTGYYHQATILSGYYELFDLLLATVTPYMFCFAASMTMLDEYDSNIIKQLSVTPVGKRGYLISRLVLPTIVAHVVSIIVLSLFSLTEWSFWMVMVICLLTSLMSVTLALFIFSFSKNKVEGMVMGKLAGLIMVGLPVPYFVSVDKHYFFFFLPSFWIAKLKIDPSILFALLAVMTTALYIILLYKKFDQKLSS